MRVVLTGIARQGDLHVLRDDLIQAAHSQNISVDAKVRTYTDYLVTDSTRKTRKRIDAEMYGVKIITTSEFIDLLGGQIEIPRTIARAAGH